jgi:hypothetical protein
LAVATLSAALLAGCSGASNFMADHTPEALGGLPADAPSRPATPTAYPAVNAVPAPRATTTLSYDQQQLLQNDLISVRNRTCATPAGSPSTAGAQAANSTPNSPAPACNSAAAAPNP